MSYELNEVLNLHPGTKAQDWLRHANGIGWIHVTAKVHATANVKGIVGARSSIGEGSSIGARSSIGAWSSIGARSSIGAGSSIGEGAYIGEGSSIGAWSSIGARSSIGAGSSMIRSPLYIVGSRHIVNEYRLGELKIGCQVHTIEHWQQHVLGIARQHGYTEAQAAEYQCYVELAATLHAARKDVEVEACAALAKANADRIEAIKARR